MAPGQRIPHTPGERRALTRDARSRRLPRRAQRRPARRRGGRARGGGTGAVTGRSLRYAAKEPACARPRRGGTASAPRRVARLGRGPRGRARVVRHRVRHRLVRARRHLRGARTRPARPGDRRPGQPGGAPAARAAGGTPAGPHALCCEAPRRRRVRPAGRMALVVSGAIHLAKRGCDRRLQRGGPRAARLDGRLDGRRDRAERV